MVVIGDGCDNSDGGGGGDDGDDGDDGVGGDGHRGVLCRSVATLHTDRTEKKADMQADSTLSGATRSMTQYICQCEAPDKRVHLPEFKSGAIPSCNNLNSSRFAWIGVFSAKLEAST